MTAGHPDAVGRFGPGLGLSSFAPVKRATAA
jgi:hypothetical protein